MHGATPVGGEQPAGDGQGPARVHDVVHEQDGAGVDSIALDRELVMHVPELLDGVLHHRLRCIAITHREARGIGQAQPVRQRPGKADHRPHRSTPNGPNARRDGRDPRRGRIEMPALPDRVRSGRDDLPTEHAIHIPAALDLPPPPGVTEHTERHPRLVR